MADIKISELTAALTVSDSDVLPMTASGSTVKVSTALLKEHAIGTTDISGIGDGTATGAIDSLNDEDTTIKAMIAPTETSPTANSWATGAQFIYNDVLYDVIADITAGDALTVGTNIAPADTVVEKLEDAVADIAQNASDITTLGASKMSYAVNTMFGVHNIAPCTATDKTSNNVTFAISSDIVTATWSNTPTGDANLSYTSTEILSPKLVAGKTYSVSGCPSGGAWEAGNKKYILSVYNTTDGTFAAIDTGDGATFTPVEGKQYNLNVTIGANAGASGSLTFAPMIKLEEDTDTTRAPYAMTNRELTEGLGNVKEIRAGRFSYTNGASIAGSVTFDKPFTKGTTTVVIITGESGNTQYITLFAAHGASASGFSYIGKNVTGDTTSAERYAQYIAVRF